MGKHEGHALLVFDEPTTGLHFDDIALLVKVFDKLVEQGSTLVVIEHNMEVIKRADHVIELGPEAGIDGGLLVAEGTPEAVAKILPSAVLPPLQLLTRGLPAACQLVQYRYDDRVPHVLQLS